MRRLKRVRPRRLGIVLTAAAVTAALAAGLASSGTTTTLFPVANGTYIDWFGDVQDVDETSNFNCGGADSIGKGGADPDRESFTVDISAVPIGATITSVAVTVRDGGSAADADGTYQTFVRINTTDADSGVNLAATTKLFDECSEPKTQIIDIPDVVKSETTTLEIGVVKTPPDGSAIRVGTITATVTYDESPTAVGDTTTVAEDDPATTIDVLANDLNADGGPMAIDSVTQPANGLVVVAMDGLSLTYEPDPGYCNGGSPTDDFTYTLSPGGSTATVAVTVTCLPSAPSCDGQAATIYVNAEGRIVGGPNDGKLYRGNLRGTTAADVMVGTGNNDQIHAKAGNDVVCAGAGNDLVEAGGGNDRLSSEDGDDTMQGGAGMDTMTGGLGADAFGGGPGTDTATDFNAGEGDTKTSVP